MYTEIVLETDRAHAQCVSDALIEFGALSACIEDAQAGSREEEPLFGEPAAGLAAPAWKNNRVIALFQDVAQLESTLSRLRVAAVGDFFVIERRAVEDTDWVRLTQSQFAPIHLGQRLWIVPSWHLPPEEATASNSIVLLLDPGLAFGTGSHATTRLCLEWLEIHLRAGQSVIDYGCGSGILAIAAKKLGAGEVWGTDIDPQAIAASTQNARDNQCDAYFVDSAQYHGPCADIVIANILSNPLKLLAPLLVDLVKPGGWLVLSGVLERQAQEVTEAYASRLRLQVWRAADGWVCLAGIKPSGRPA